MKCIALSAVVLAALAATGASPALTSTPRPVGSPAAPVSLAVEPGHANAKLHSLGKATIGDHEVEALQDGKVQPGKESNFELKLTAKPGIKKPKAIRGWIGIASAKGSVKAKAHYHGDEIDLHLETPDPLPPESKLWIELETDSGKQTGSFMLKQD